MWDKIKKWLKETAGPAVLKCWFQAVNVLVVLIAYGKLDDLGSPAANWVGFWGFILIGYWIFWEFFGAGKIVMPLLKKLWKKIFGKKGVTL